MQQADNPEAWRAKPSSQQTERGSYGVQRPVVDTLHQGREKKTFFETIDNSQDDSYFPYGAPGGGAPLRNDDNKIRSKLPHTEENLWKTNNPAPNVITHDLNPPPSPARVNALRKRDEIHNFIDEITKPKPLYNDFNVHDRDNIYTRPKKVKNVDPNHYWTDWFGRPGGGAPNYDSRKKNLDYMLEPKNSRESYRPVYDPAASLSPPVQTLCE